MEDKLEEFFLPQEWVSFSALRFSTLHNDPGAHQDHCVRSGLEPGTSATEVWPEFVMGEKFIMF